MPSNDDELFHLALRFVDQTKGFEDSLVGLREQFEQSLQQTHADLGEDTREAFSDQIMEYIQQLVYPSHLSVILLLQHGYLDRAVKISKALMNPLEKRMSFQAVFNYFLSCQMYEEALLLVNQLTEEEGIACVSHFAERFLDNDLLALLLSLTRRIKNSRVRLEIYKNAAYGLAGRGQVEESLKMLGYLSEDKNYGGIQSNVVRILAEGGFYGPAEELAVAIVDELDREDAINSVLSVRLRKHQETEAMAFTESLRGTDEKIQAAKFIERSMLSHHDYSQVKSLRNRFHLPEIVYKRAA